MSFQESQLTKKEAHIEMFTWDTNAVRLYGATGLLFYSYKNPSMNSCILLHCKGLPHSLWKPYYYWHSPNFSLSPLKLYSFTTLTWTPGILWSPSAGAWLHTTDSGAASGTRPPSVWPASKYSIKMQGIQKTQLDFPLLLMHTSYETLKGK